MLPPPCGWQLLAKKRELLPLRSNRTKILDHCRKARKSLMSTSLGILRRYRSEYEVPLILSATSNILPDVTYYIERGRLRANL